MYKRQAYDVNTETAEGRRRLRKVAKICTDYGQRVQASVFECCADAATFAVVRDKLLGVVDLEKDSLRFYKMGRGYEKRNEHHGARPGYEAEGFLSF